TKLFHTNYDTPAAMADLPRPIFLYAGRVAIEKNIEAFLKLDLPGSKVVIGDGPPREGLQKRYPDTHFVGYKFGEELAAHYAAGDVFVFPSKTDTFGVVMLAGVVVGLDSLAAAASSLGDPAEKCRPRARRQCAEGRERERGAWTPA
ncbi:MAG: glycosyltransferase family 1 protein, partial [Caldilineaceae bacterium]|nr:glycosyltransferase family 1 protein [Caldilineaceae bacterium]